MTEGERPKDGDLALPLVLPSRRHGITLSSLTLHLRLPAEPGKKDRTGYKTREQ